MKGKAIKSPHNVSNKVSGKKTERLFSPVFLEELKARKIASEIF